MQKVGGPSPLSPTSFHGPGLRATPARALSRSGSGSELALPAPSVPRPAPSPPDAWPVAGNLRTARVAECQPTLRSERAASAFPFQRGDPAATRRCPHPLRAARQRWPVSHTARSGRFRRPPARPIPPKSTNIFLEISTFYFHTFHIPHGGLPQPRFARQPPLGGGRPGSGRHRGTSPVPRYSSPSPHLPFPAPRPVRPTPGPS